MDAAGTANDLQLSFSRNPAGQIASVVRSNDLFAWTGHGNGQLPYDVNGLNQVARAGAALTYDARGNVTGDGTRSFAYTAENRLANVSGAELAHDPLGRLHHVSSPNNSFFYEGSELVAEWQPQGTLVRRYVPGAGPDEPLVQYRGAGLSDRRFLHGDERGSIVALTDNAGNLAAANRYDEHGRVGANHGSRFGFTGQNWLPTLGLYDYGARFYDPALGRFLQPDPIGYADGANLYAYVGGDPVNWADPWGMNKGQGPNPHVKPKDGPRGPADDGGIVVNGRPERRCLTCDAPPLPELVVTGGDLFGTPDGSSMTEVVFNGAAGEQLAVRRVTAKAFARWLVSKLAPKATSRLAWKLGSKKSAQQWQNRMKRGGWTEDQIDEAVQNGKQFSAPNNINPAHGATRFVHPTNGKSVVRDNVTGEIIHIGAPGYVY